MQGGGGGVHKGGGGIKILQWGQWVIGGGMSV